MPEPAPGRPESKAERREITFGLRDAVILAVVAITIACAVVYRNVT